ncbi:trypsin-like serine protease [Saccharothrix sp. NRRL B-16314]|uniref:trypsin-like serine protease n=1 Tax=Saccharothrix sp. NRRL B-16314 TaxID=1463825 RepID=UPI000526DCEA|nr:trypsin-like serine protease [Saccharothrix sp. NRRL B-16314]
MRTATVAAAVVALAAVTALPASAINTYNAVPAPERTEVGALVATWDNDDNPATPDRVDWVCSGTMVDAGTFLTAAHCVDGWPSNVKFYVSLTQDVQSALDAATGTPAQKAAAVGVQGVAHADPSYPGNSADSHDIAVIEVPAKQVAARWSFTPATLPTAGKLDAMGPKALDAAEYTVVGYGTEEAQNGPGGQTHPGGGVRMKASLGFNALNNTWLRLSMIEAQGNGGACYGDSGGPNFATIDGKRVLVATTITGDAPCYATNVVYRLDAPSARSFLAPFVALP